MASSSSLEPVLVVYVPLSFVEAEATRSPPPPSPPPKKKSSPPPKFLAALSLALRKLSAQIKAQKRAVAKAKRNAEAAAAGKGSAAAEARRSERRALFFDRCVGAVDSFEVAVSLFAEFERAAADFGAAAEEDTKLAAVRFLFESGERAAAEAEVEAGAALALASGAVRALFVRAERASVAAEAARLRASLPLEAAARAIVVRAGRANAKRDLFSAARRLATAGREADAELALSSVGGLFVRAERAAVAFEAEVGAPFALGAARAVFARDQGRCERDLVRSERRAAVASRSAGTELAAASASSLFIHAERAAVAFGFCVFGRKELHVSNHIPSIPRNDPSSPRSTFRSFTTADFGIPP